MFLLVSVCSDTAQVLLSCLMLLNIIIIIIIMGGGGGREKERKIRDEGRGQTDRQTETATETETDRRTETQSFYTVFLVFSAPSPRNVPMPTSDHQNETRDRILHLPDLPAEHPHRHPVVGLLLDRPRGRPRQDLRGSAHRAHHHHAALGVKGAAAQSALHQGQQKLVC